MHYIGMDVHSKVTMICILDENGKVLKERVIHGSLRELVAAVRCLPRPFKICYEASCGYGWLHDQVRGLAQQVVVAHPGKVRLIFNCKRKSDRIDARKLATLLFLGQVPPVHVPGSSRRQWRALIEYRHRLVARRVAVKNMIRALVRSVGLKSPRALWGKKGRQWLLEQELDGSDALRREMLLEELDAFTGRINRMGRELDKLAGADAGVTVLVTIPGVGIRTAEAVVAYIDDAERFGRNKSVGCYFGMVPSEDTSVKSRFGHITREGPPTVRRLVIEACWQGIRRDQGLRAYFERIMREDVHRKKIALVATAHHLLRVMHAMLRTGEVWRTAA
jgi:transposase